jgi:hypothetical protein
MFAVTAGLLGLLFAAAPVAAQSAGKSAKATSATELSSQNHVRRARTRILVQPVYPYRRFHALYPLPYDIEYPGPNARRECVNRYVTEYRPSGPVVVPHMRCWWVR